MVGTSVAHYRIVTELARGGMGIIYKAKDLTLKRTVALKFLPKELTGDETAKQRFIQEARSASSLDHPNICTIHEFGETDDGQLYIAMTCYEGETLKERLTRGPLSVGESLEIIMAIAGGLACAHEHGIIHRDVKPANIFITEKHEIKILDFGLAKLAGRQKLTVDSATLGTVAYMSPEQARGEAIDQRADIWSLGIILFEMLTGKLPFKGEDGHPLIYSILHDEPLSITDLHSGLPVQLDAVVRKMLEKTPSDRFQNGEELINTLCRFLSDPDIRCKELGLRPRHRSSTLRLLRQFGWIPMTAAAVSILWLTLFRQRADARPAWMRGMELAMLTSDVSEELGRISPDGLKLVYSTGADNLTLEFLETGVKKPLAFPDSLSPTELTWAPDSRRFAVRGMTHDRDFLVICNTLSDDIKILHTSDRNAEIQSPAWAPDNHAIAFIDFHRMNHKWQSTLKVIDLAGYIIKETVFESITEPICWSPDASHIACMQREKPLSDSCWIRIFDLNSDTLSEPVAGIHPPRFPWIQYGVAWSPAGDFLVYIDEVDGYAELFALPLDTETYTAAGPPLRVTYLIDPNEPAWPGFTRDGKKLCLNKISHQDELYAVSLAEHETTTADEIVYIAVNQALNEDPCWMPDGQNIIYCSNHGDQWDLHQFDIVSGLSQPITATPEREMNPRILPDGMSVSFYCDGTIYILPLQNMTASAVTPDTLICGKLHDWSKDGKTLFLTVLDRDNADVIHLFARDMETGTMKKLFANMFRGSRDIRTSSDGKYLALFYDDPNIFTEKICIINLITNQVKWIDEHSMYRPRGRGCWSHDNQYLICDVPDGTEYYITYFPVDGSASYKYDLDLRFLEPNTFLEGMNPAGDIMLIKKNRFGRDIAYLGE